MYERIICLRVVKYIVYRLYHFLALIVAIISYTVGECFIHEFSYVSVMTKIECAIPTFYCLSTRSYIRIPIAGPSFYY